MIYIIKGNEEYFVKEKLNEIIDKDSNIIEFDGSNKTFNISDMLEACQTSSLFSNKNTILVRNPYFLIKKEDNIEDLMNYINHPLYETDLIFYSYDDSFNERLKLFKDISKNADVIRCDSLNYKDFNQYAYSIFNKSELNLSDDIKRLLIEYANNNATLLNANIEILKLYPDRIDKDVVLSLCSENDELNVFDLINSLTNKDISTSITLARKLLKNNDSILPLIGLLSGQLRFLYQVAYLRKEGHNIYDIMNITGYKEFRIKNAFNTLNKLNMKEIMNLLYKLHEIDISVKTNNEISEKNRLEFFILNLLNENEK